MFGGGEKGEGEGKKTKFGRYTMGPTNINDGDDVLMILVAGLSSKCRYSKPDFSINGDFHLQDNIESS